MSGAIHSKELLSEKLLASLGLHALVPPSLSAWRPLVIAGMTFFLRRLPEQRVAEIVMQQLVLPANASTARRLVLLLAQCPALHKLGQVLAHQPQLHPDLRRQLQTLESMPATTPMDRVLASIRRELPRDAPVHLADQALAEGSVAVVLPFTYEEDGETRHGVFKILKPGIEQKLAEELAVWPDLATFLEEKASQAGLPALDFRGTLDSVRRLLLSEVRLDVEQRNLVAAAAFYADEPRLLVPRVLRWSTARMTAMERVFGEKITQAKLSRTVRRSLADTMVAALVGRAFWSRAEIAVIHADLHAGNLFVADDGRLAVLDWSLTASLSKARREALVAIALGGLTLDAARICAAVAALGSLVADDAVLVETVERSLDRIVNSGRLPTFDWLLQLLDELALRTDTGFGEDFLLLRKTWLSLSGVIGSLVDNPSPDGQLLGLALLCFIEEAPARSLALPNAQHFATHVSNADVVKLLWSPWLVSLRYWNRKLRLMATPGQQPIQVAA